MTSPPDVGFKSHPSHQTAHPTHFDADILVTLLQMKRNGYPESTIRSIGKRLRNLAQDCDLSDSEAVKRVIAAKAVAEGYKLFRKPK